MCSPHRGAGSWLPLLRAEYRHQLSGILLQGKLVILPYFKKKIYLFMFWCFRGGSDSKESAFNAGDLGSIPGLGKCPGEGKGNPLLYSCLGNPKESRAWRAIVHRVAEWDMTERLTYTFNFWLHFVFIAVHRLFLIASLLFV